MVINNTVDATGALGNFLAPINISNNQLRVKNYYASVTATESSSALWISGTTVNINNNYLSLFNDETPNNSTITVIYLDTGLTMAADAPEPSLITDNIISRKDTDGTEYLLVNGFIYITSTSQPGTIHGNVFSNDTIDGTLETVIVDDSSSWISYNNINEIQTITIMGGTGQLGLSTGSTDEAIVVRGANIPISGGLSFVSFNKAGSATAAATLGHRDNASSLNFHWVIPFAGLVPIGVQIIHVSTAVDVTANGSDGQSVLKISSSAGFETNSSPDPLTTAGHSHVLETADQGGSGATEMTGIYKNFGNNAAFIEVFGDSFVFANSQNYSVGNITVKYRW